MNMKREVISPGEFLKEEIDARGWSQVELAEIMGRPSRLVNEIIAGKKSITPETALQLGDAFGTSAELWMSLEAKYQLSKVPASDDLVSRKAKLYMLYPVRDMLKRNWICSDGGISEMEERFLKFFSIGALGERPELMHAAKKTDAEDTATYTQLAWLFRVKQIASTVIAPNYNENKLRAALATLQSLLTAPEEARKAPGILTDCGVRFVVVEGLPGAKIDGACFWLDDKSPVIGMTMLRDRIDNFWFVLRHEIEHVLQRHGRGSPCIDENIGSEGSGTTIGEEEAIANSAASEFCVNQKDLSNFIARVNPFFSEQKVLGFASRLNIHPGMVVGQLQWRLNRYDFLKKYQPKIRQFVISSAATDGFGTDYPV